MNAASVAGMFPLGVRVRAATGLRWLSDRAYELSGSGFAQGIADIIAEAPSAAGRALANLSGRVLGCGCTDDSATVCGGFAGADDCSCACHGRGDWP